MRHSPKTTVLSLVVLAGTIAAAQAQGVANLPPGSAQPKSAAPPAYAAPQAAKPNPGGGTSIAGGQPYQQPADWDRNGAYHPYSTKGMGPSAGGGVTANNEPNPPPPGAAIRAPYSSKGQGPNAGANVTVPAPAR